MSSFRAAYINVSKVELSPQLPSIWSRGGFSGVTVRHEDREYEIPEGVLWTLFAEEFKRRQISKIEQMDTEDVRALVGVSDVRGK